MPSNELSAVNACTWFWCFSLTREDRLPPWVCTSVLKKPKAKSLLGNKRRCCGSVSRFKAGFDVLAITSGLEAVAVPLPEAWPKHFPTIARSNSCCNILWAASSVLTVLTGCSLLARTEQSLHQRLCAKPEAQANLAHQVQAATAAAVLEVGPAEYELRLHTTSKSQGLLDSTKS